MTGICMTNRCNLGALTRNFIMIAIIAYSILLCMCLGGRLLLSVSLILFSALHEKNRS